MTSPFDGLEVDPALRPAPADYGFDLAERLAGIVAVEAHVPETAHTASILGTLRIGNGCVISPRGLVLTAGYLILEAEDVTLITEDGRRIFAHPLGVDAATGFGLLQALEPLELPVLPLGASKDLQSGLPIIIAGAGGIPHAAAGKVLTRMPFAGSWEYLLDDAIMTEPAHPHWSGAGLLSAKGDLVGLASLSLSRRTRAGVSPLNMSVPIDLLPPILDDLANGRPGSPPRPWLGVFTQEAGEALVVTGLSPGGPASRAELRAGDTILALGGSPVTGQEDFYRRLWALGDPRAQAQLTLRRDGDVFDVSVRAMDRNALFRRSPAH